MTEWIDDRSPIPPKKNPLAELEMDATSLLMEAYQAGKKAAAEETAMINKMTNDQEWLRKEIDEARGAGYKRGFKEGQKSVIKSIEDSNRKIYEG